MDSIARSSTHSVSTPKTSSISVLRLRCGLGMSRADFARVLGVSWEDVARWEQGAVEPTHEMGLRMTQLDQQAESHAERTLLRPALDVALKQRNLDQIHSSEITLT